MATKKGKTIGRTPVLEKFPRDEKEFLRQIIELAHYCGFKVAHFRPARVIIKGQETWRTPVQGDGAGFNDLFLARERGGRGDGRLIFAELKSEKGELTSEQEAWQEVLKGTGKCEVYVWRPRDFETIVKVLK